MCLQCSYYSSYGFVEVHVHECVCLTIAKTLTGHNQLGVHLSSPIVLTYHSQHIKQVADSRYPGLDFHQTKHVLMSDHRIRPGPILHVLLEDVVSFRGSISMCC